MDGEPKQRIKVPSRQHDLDLMIMAIDQAAGIQLMLKCSRCLVHFHCAPGLGEQQRREPGKEWVLNIVQQIRAGAERVDAMKDYPCKEAA